MEVAQTQTQIAADMLAAISTSTSEVTNFNVGSLVRSLVDAYSAEAAQIEQEIEEQVSTAIINAIYQLLNMTPTGAVGSTYLLQFTLSPSATSSVTIPAGTAVATPNSTLQWTIGQSIMLSPGQSATVTATCTTTGSQTNVPANTITQLVTPIAGVTVTNLSGQPVIPGRDAETQVELQARAANAINQLHRGDAGALEAGALTSQLVDASGNPTEQVVKALAVDSLTPGLCYVFVNNGVGPMSQALLQQTQQIINGYVDNNGVVHIGYKAAGVTATVLDAPQTVVNVSVEVLPSNGYTLAMVQDSVNQAIQDFFANLDLGQSLSLSQLYFAILAVPGVADVLITSPSSSLPAIPYVTPPSSAPSATAVSASGSTLAAGTYQVAITFTNQWGETTPSPAASVTVSSGQGISIPAVTLPVGATGVNYYVSQTAGSSTLVLAASGNGSSAVTITSPPTSSQQPPATNTAAIQGNAYMLGTVTISQMQTS